MQKGAIKAVVLTVIFFVAVGVFSMMTNHVNEDLTTEMKNATLPVITLESSEQEVNELYGYRTKMNAASMRDTITPIGKTENFRLRSRHTRQAWMRSLMKYEALMGRD